MPMFSQAGFYGLIGWGLFFFAAAIGSGNFPGNLKVSNCEFEHGEVFLKEGSMRPSNDLAELQ